MTFGNGTDATVRNCTITDNHARQYGGGIYLSGETSADILNSIVWGNGATQIVDDTTTGPVVVACSNVDLDPLFCNEQMADFHLSSSSPLLDAGCNAYAPSGTDLDEQPRIVDGPDINVSADVDMGAYEYQNLGCNAGGIPLACPCSAGTITSAVPASGTRDARQPHPVNDNTLFARQGIGSGNTYTGGPEPIKPTLQNAGLAVTRPGF
jgi:hypothetical protein